MEILGEVGELLSDEVLLRGFQIGMVVVGKYWQRGCLVESLDD